MKSRSLLILALVVAVVGGYIFFHERHQMTSDERQERADKVFPELDRDDVRSLEIHNSHGSFRITKDDDGWRLLEPIDFPADSAAVSSLLTSLENLDVERTLGTSEVEFAAYGLDDPEMTVALETEDGESFALSVGGEAALGSNRAFRRGDEQAIILGRGWFLTDLDKELDEWRSRDVVDVVAGDVASLQVVAGEDRIQVVREGRVWRLIEPLEDLADGNHVGNLITDLNDVRVEAFLDEAVDSAELGLDPPAFQVTIVRSDGDDPVRLAFGAVREHEGSTQVACRRNESELFWVSDKAATRLTKAPVRWRATKVRDFDTWDAERLRLTAGEGAVYLTRNQGLWETTDGGEVNHAEVQDRLSKLASLEAVEFDLIEPGTEALGSIELALSADGDGAQPVISYTFYPPLAEGGGAMVVVSGRSTVMSVDASAANEILGDPSSLVKQEQDEEKVEEMK